MDTKQAALNRPSQTVIHICRSIEYRGGVEAVLVDLLSFEKSIAHVLVCTEGAPGERTSRLLERGVPVYHVTGCFMKKVSALRAIVKRYRNPILHTHLFRPELLGIFVTGCKRRITTKYCTYASDSQVGKGVMGRLRRFFDNHILDYVVSLFYQDIVVITDELQEKWRLLNKRVHLIPISTIRSYANERPSRILGPDLVLIAAGRMVEEKQHDLLVAALRQIRCKKLFLLGDGPLREQIKERLADHGIDNVEIPGAVSRQEVLDYMDRADALLLTSRTEGLPLLIQEAMSRGLPVVATAVGGNHTLVDDQTGAIVSGNDPESFGAAVNSLIGRDIGEMSRAALERCRRRCSFEDTCRRIVELYRSDSRNGGEI